jgi:hypothetical protein
MTYDLSPAVTRLTPFSNDGGALAALDVHFGPIMVRARLYRNSNGYFLSYPSRKSEASEKWYDQVAIADARLRDQAKELAIKHYKILSEGELVAV